MQEAVGVDEDVPVRLAVGLIVELVLKVTLAEIVEL